MTQSIHKKLRNLGLAAALGFAFAALPAVSSAEAGHRHSHVHKHFKHHGGVFVHKPFHHRPFVHRTPHRTAIIIHSRPPVHVHRPKGFVHGYVPVHPGWRPMPYGVVRHPGPFQYHYR